jgi:hypothetical protein
LGHSSSLRLDGVCCSSAPIFAFGNVIGDIPPNATLASHSTASGPGFAAVGASGCPRGRDGCDVFLRRGGDSGISCCPEGSQWPFCVCVTRLPGLFFVLLPWGDPGLALVYKDTPRFLFTLPRLSHCTGIL